MITLLGRDKCRPVYVPEKYIDHMEELVEDTPERAYPYTRIYVKVPAEKYDYYIDVVESVKKINQLIAEKQNEGGSTDAGSK